VPRRNETIARWPTRDHLALFHGGDVSLVPGWWGGYPAQAELWRWRTAGRLVLHDLTGNEVDRMASLMDKYNDRPMDLADASLVAAAERLGARHIFTLDSDFHIYRLADGSVLDCVP
jgi:predicted nucleic acid-binding protein